MEQCSGWCGTTFQLSWNKTIRRVWHNVSLIRCCQDLTDGSRFFVKQTPNPKQASIACIMFVRINLIYSLLYTRARVSCLLARWSCLLHCCGLLLQGNFFKHIPLVFSTPCNVYVTISYLDRFHFVKSVVFLIFVCANKRLLRYSWQWYGPTFTACRSLLNWTPMSLKTLWGITINVLKGADKK